jgi:RNA polymerase sigma factor (sigma-70 family)
VDKRTAQARVDSQLVERCLQGDEAAWEELVRRYQRLIYSVAHVLCPPGEDVSDAFQQVWLDVYQHLGELRSVEALPAWLITVTRRRMYALIRSRHDTEQLEEEMSGVAEQLNQIDYEHTLERVLDQLPERCRRTHQLPVFRFKRAQLPGDRRHVGHARGQYRAHPRALFGETT